MRKKSRLRSRLAQERIRKTMRESARLNNIINGISEDLTVKQIHYKTGLTEKNIRKILQECPEEITFLLLKKQHTKEKK